MTIQHFYLEQDYDIPGLAEAITGRCRRAGKPLELDDIREWSSHRRPRFEVNLAVDAAIANGWLVSAFLGPRHRIRQYISAPEYLPVNSEVWFLSCVPEIEAKLDYKLISHESLRRQQLAAAAARAAEAEAAAELGKRQHAEFVVKKENDLMDQIELSWSAQYRQLKPLFVERSKTVPSYKRQAWLDGQLARRKRDYCEDEFKRLWPGHQADEEFLNRIAPLSEPEAEPV